MQQYVFMSTKTYKEHSWDSEAMAQLFSALILTILTVDGSVQSRALVC